MFKIIKKINVSKFQEELLEKEVKFIFYEKPEFTSLSEEQIAAIHARGHITQEEKVKEWEILNLCAPGSTVDIAAWRCHKFNRNCHDCLVDYSLNRLEYVSNENVIKLCNPEHYSNDNTQKKLKKD